MWCVKLEESKTNSQTIKMNSVFRVLTRQVDQSTVSGKYGSIFRWIQSKSMRTEASQSASDERYDKLETLKERMDRSMQHFIDTCRNYETKSISPIVQLQARLQEKAQDSSTTKEKNPMQYMNRDIMELISLSCTDTDVDFLTKVVREHAMAQFQEVHKTNYGKYLIMLIVSLRKTDKLIELIRDKSNNVILRQHSTTELILHYLLEEKMHKEINELLVDRLPKYVRIVDRNHEQDLRQNRKDLKKVCHIPNSHMEIYTRSLMLQDSEKAYFMFKELVDYIYKNDGQVSKHTVLRLLYYSIKMKNGGFGFDIFYTDLFSKDEELKLNLYVMLHSRQKNKNHVIKNLQNILNKNLSFYPYTFKVIREDIKENKEPSSYIGNIDHAYRRALHNGLLSAKDFTDIVYGQPWETPDIFGKEQGQF